MPAYSPESSEPLSCWAGSGSRERTFRASLDFSSEPERTFLEEPDWYITQLDGSVDLLWATAIRKKAILDSGQPLRRTRATGE